MRSDLLQLTSAIWAIRRDVLTAILADVAHNRLPVIEAAQPQAYASQPGAAVAVIPIHGCVTYRPDFFSMLFGGAVLKRIQEQFRQAMADDMVRAIVFEFSSPGGLVDGVPEFADEIFKARGTKPLIAMIQHQAASAGYWLATQCDEIVMSRSADVGSIGCYCAHEEYTKMLKALGIVVTLISAGENKTKGNEFEPLPDDAREYFQGRVNEVNAEFVEQVARGRGVSTKVVNETYGQGWMFRAKQAKKLGMADRVATFEEVIAKLVGKRVGSGARAEADESMRLHAGEEPREKPAIPVTSEVVEDLEVATGLAESLLASRMEPDAESATEPVAAAAEPEPEPAEPDPWPALNLRRRALELGV